MNWLTRLEIMKAENLVEDKIWNSREIREIPQILQPEVRTDIPGLDEALVFGDPIRLGDVLDFQQGFDNSYGALGTCGQTSVANICKMAGMKVTEPEVLKYSMENNLVIEHPNGSVSMGETRNGDLIALLEHYLGMDVHCEFAGETASPARLASAVEGGHGVILALNPGVLRNQEWRLLNEKGEFRATHAVTLTGTVRDMDGNLKGFYLCDSTGQNPDAGRTFVPLEKFISCYSNTLDGVAIITDHPIRR